MSHGLCRLCSKSRAIRLYVSRSSENLLLFSYSFCGKPIEKQLPLILSTTRLMVVVLEFRPSNSFPRWSLKGIVQSLNDWMVMSLKNYEQSSGIKKRRDTSPNKGWYCKSKFNIRSVLLMDNIGGRIEGFEPRTSGVIIQCSTN